MIKIRSAFILRAFALLLMGTFASGSWASPIQINTYDRGWYRSNDGYSDFSNDSYVTGRCGDGGPFCGQPRVRNSYFAFDLEGFAGNATSATLHLFNPESTLGPPLHRLL